MMWSGWVEPRAWPQRDRAGWVFLGRAFNLIGEAIFDAWWTGNENREAGEKIPPFVPPVDDAFSNGEPIETRHRHYGLRVNGVLGLPPMAPISAAAWEAAASYYAEQRLKVLGARARRKQVADEIGELASLGLIVTGYSPRGGGEVISMPPSMWSDADNLAPRFSSLGLNMARPFDWQAKPDAWLWVDQHSLGEVVAAYAGDEQSLTNPEVASTAPTGGQAIVERRATAIWFVEQIEACWYDPPTVEALLDRAKARFGDGLNRDRIRELRRLLAPHHWKARGVHPDWRKRLTDNERDQWVTNCRQNLISAITRH